MTPKWIPFREQARPYGRACSLESSYRSRPCCQKTSQVKSSQAKLKGNSSGIHSWMHVRIIENRIENSSGIHSLMHLKVTKTEKKLPRNSFRFSFQDDVVSWTIQHRFVKHPQHHRALPQAHQLSSGGLNLEPKVHC